MLPSSSMLISAPVSATMPLMVLPPGPMMRPILSGLILIVSMRGTGGLGAVEAAVHGFPEDQAGVPVGGIRADFGGDANVGDAFDEVLLQ